MKKIALILALAGFFAVGSAQAGYSDLTTWSSGTWSRGGSGLNDSGLTITPFDATLSGNGPYYDIKFTNANMYTHMVTSENSNITSFNWSFQANDPVQEPIAPYIDYAYYSLDGVTRTILASTTGIGGINIGKNGNSGIQTFTFTTPVRELTFGVYASYLLGNPPDSVYPGPAIDSTLFISEVDSTTAITPVPEPESYAMLLAGLGLMGFMSRRRKVS